jgi:hypothetical protein
MRSRIGCDPNHASCGEELSRRESYVVWGFRDEALLAFGVSIHLSPPFAV